MESSIVKYQPIYNIIDNIKIYNGLTLSSQENYEARIAYLKNLIKDYPPLFTDLESSTLTAQGVMTNISFEEKNLINYLEPPTKYIVKIGCNYGEIFHPDYVEPEKKKTSGRGRKPKPKIKSRRKTQGNGKYFSSQITFEIEHPDSKIRYKIKLFRTGVFQVPGVRDPSMQDLIKPIEILRKYLAYNFAEDVQVLDFVAVMRNYKARLINEHYHVNLNRLEELIIREKIDPVNTQFIDFMLRNYSSDDKEAIIDMLDGYNPLSIAEMTYNTDRCFSLIIKYYRASINDINKKTTVKLLKKGKINFDGGNSQQEVEELYYWLIYIYNKYKDEILFDIQNIKNEYNEDSSDTDSKSLYERYSDEESDYSSEDSVEENEKNALQTSRLIINALRRPRDYVPKKISAIKNAKQ